MPDNTIGWGQGAVNNDIGWGKGVSNNDIGWGNIANASPSGDTDLTGGSAYENTYSLNLDGADDRGNAGVLTDLNGLTAFSVSLWFKRTANGDRSSRFLFGNRDSSNSYRGVAMEFGRDAPSAYDHSIYVYGTNTSYAYFVLPSSYGRSINVWHNFVVTFDFSRTDVFKGYWNGGNEVSLPNNGANPSNVASTGNFYIADDVGVEFKGFMDEFAIFDKALTPQDASDIYNGGVAGDISSLSPLHWWRNEEGSGTTITNSGSGSNVLTLENGTLFSTDVPI